MNASAGGEIMINQDWADAIPLLEAHAKHYTDMAMVGEVGDGLTRAESAAFCMRSARLMRAAAELCRNSQKDLVQTQVNAFLAAKGGPPDGSTESSVVP